MPAEAKRLKLVGFIHHPLADETGLTVRKTARFQAAERRLLPLLRGVVCPSRNTADVLIDYGVAPERIVITPPGTIKAVSARSATNSAASCVFWRSRP